MSRLGVNCWTLVCLVYLEQLGIALPTYQDDFVSLEEHREVEALFHGERGKDVWSPVNIETSFDVAVFRRGRFLSHVGIVVRPGAMLHVTAGGAVGIERYDTSPQWKPRLQHIYRHVDTTANRSAVAA